MSHIIITNDNFDAEVLSSEKTVLLRRLVRPLQDDRTHR